MNKELNPSLFGHGSSIQSRILEPQGISMSAQLETKMGEMKAQLNQMQEQWTRSVSQVQEFVKASQVKFDRIQSALSKLEQNDQMINMESSQKIAQIQNRLGERKSMDLKIQEMMDRHNSVLRSFEVRMSQMQKMLAEKEAAFMSAQSSLNEAKMEIARLKRL